jgi:uncharacterized membrane protein YbhN (UPF0104 family)
VVNIRPVIDIGKYVLAAGLLSYVVWANWSPAPLAGRLAADVIKGLLGDEPNTPPPQGLKQVWERHVVEREPIGAGYLLAAFAVYAGALSLTLVRWFFLVRALGLQITFRDAIRYGLVGIFFNTFLPGSVGGDIIKAAVLAHGQERRTAAVATVIMDRMIALWALVWFVALIGGACWLGGWLTGAAAVTVVTIALTIAGVTGAIWLLMGLLSNERAEWFAESLGGLPWVGGPVSELWRSAWMYRQQSGTVAFVMALSWLGHVGFVVSFYLGVCALWSPDMGPLPSFAQHFLLVPIGLVVQALVPTPGGAGGGECGFGALYTLFGGAEANGVLASLVQRVFSWMAGLTGYLVYLWARPSLPAQQEQPTEAPLVEQQPSALAG